MIDFKKIIDLIINYENYIEKGNTILKKKYKIDESPLLGRRKGDIPVSGILKNENMSFNFHGMGCTFKFDKIVVDFDYTFGKFTYKGFEVQKFYVFLESYLNSEKKDISEKSLRISLKKMEEIGLLEKIESSSYDTYDYILSR